MRYLYIDPSLNNIGWAIIDVDREELVEYGFYKVQEKGEQRWLELLNLPDYFANKRFDRIGIEMAEHFIYTRNRNRKIQKSLDILRRATQSIIDGFRVRGIPVAEIPVARGKGRKSKYETVSEVMCYYNAKVEKVFYNGRGQLKKFPDHTADAITMGMSHAREIKFAKINGEK